MSCDFFTIDDLKKVYKAGYRNGSKDGMRVVRGCELNITTFEEWYEMNDEMER